MPFWKNDVSADVTLSEAEKGFATSKRRIGLAGAVRWAATAGFLVGQLLQPWGGTGLAVATLCTLLALDVRRPYAVVNVVALYFYLILEIGPSVIGIRDVTQVQAFGASVAFALLVGATAGRVLASARTTANRDSQALSRMAAAHPQAHLRSISLMKFTLIVNLALIALDVGRFGLSSYLGGVSLAGSIETYGDGGLDIFQVLGLLARTLAILAVCLHFSVCDRVQGLRARWGVVLGLLIAVPLLSLSRSQLVVSALVLLYLTSVGRDTKRRSGSSAVQASVVILSFVLVATASVSAGLLRERALGEKGDARNSVVTGEFSPVIVVAKGLETHAQRLESTSLVLPTIVRFAPRRIFPNKPDNTTARFMKAHFPQSFAAGYSLAPTLVGALLLTVGMANTLLATAILAFLATILLDRRRILSPLTIGLTALVYGNLYSLVRNDPSNALADFMAALVAFWLIRTWLTRPGRR